MEYIAVTKGSHLSHHGVKGMKWGVRKGRDVGKKNRKANKLYFVKNRGSDKKPKVKRVSFIDRHILEKNKYLDTSGKLTSRGKKYLDSYMRLNSAIGWGAFLGGLPGGAIGAGVAFATDPKIREKEFWGA